MDADTETPIDLVGGPFAVIESDPAVFTSLTRKLGIHGLEVVEMYDIEPWAVDHLSPRGLIFCFLWGKDTHRRAEFADAASSERVWFANQLDDNACASLAILNVLLNCPDVQLGETLEEFKKDTAKMSSVMKGLAVSNAPVIRLAHNPLARPADIRGSLNTIAKTTLDAAKKSGQQPPAKKRKLTTTNGKKTTTTKTATSTPSEEEETYHFIGYVPAYGKVWELDGLKSGPLEVGELEEGTQWMDVVRPALRMKMQKYNDGENIRFSLCAIVDDQYQHASDELEMLKRERIILERRMAEAFGEEAWTDKVDQPLLHSSHHAFTTTTQPSPSPSHTYAPNFGARKLPMELRVLDMPAGDLVPAWEACVRNAMRGKVAVEDEVGKSVRANTDHIERTHDYEPFFREFITALHSEGLLYPLLDRDENGKKIPGPAAAANGNGKGKGAASTRGKKKK